MQKSLLENRSPKLAFVNQPLVIAHRGASGLAPENTLAAFKLALALGVAGIELDVHLSADDKPVVIHDARVNRTTNAAGQVASFAAAELHKLDAGSWFARKLLLRPRARKFVEQTWQTNNSRFAAALAKTKPKTQLAIDFSNEGVPTLEEVFSLDGVARLTRLYVELKGEASRKKALLEATLVLVKKYKLQQAVTLLSFDHSIIAYAKQLAPEIRTAATFPVAGKALATSRLIIKSIEQLAADEAALHYGLATRRTVAALHERGIAVSVWTANSKMTMRRLIAGGVDAMMTNFPNRLTELLQEKSLPV
jgi:glycerophosphoryl diester phosphodiesterase